MNNIVHAVKRISPWENRKIPINSASEEQKCTKEYFEFY